MVQNQFIELMLETGVVGLAIFLVIVALFFRKTIKTQYAWAIIVAFLAQWWFFSGYPNAIHIFVIMIFLYYFAQTQKQTR